MAPPLPPQPATAAARRSAEGVRRAARVDHRRHGRLHPLRHAVLSPGDPGPPRPESAHIPAGDGLLSALLKHRGLLCDKHASALFVRFMSHPVTEEHLPPPTSL